jgi:D-alanyl-D-alanine carboxypeptidase/D-alanyl-D-alanine-endopeptidase (penicillin-binding protein 4)
VLQVGLSSKLPLLVLGSLLAGNTPAVGQQTASFDSTLQRQLDRWFSRAARAVPGEWGVAVADSRGNILWSVNPTRPLVPASTVKVFTTGFARSVLGGEARQTTRVLGTGSIDENGTWVGLWALELNGDPTLERPLRSGPTLRDLASQLADRGIRRLVGPLKLQSAWGEAAAVYPTAWSPKHKGRRFAPLIGEVTLNENLVTFTVAPGRVGQPARVIGSAPEGVASLVEMRAKTVKGRRNSLVFRQLPDGRFVVRGTIGTRVRGRTWSGPSTNPMAVLEASWGTALAGAGIEWVRAQSVAGEGPAALGRLTLAEVASAPLDSIASEVNTRSLNIGAEALLRWAAGPEPAAAERLTRHVREVIGEGSSVHLVDGSGLSYDDRASPRDFVTYMARFPATPAGRNFPMLLPANGSGTLRRFQRRGPLAPGVVRAKTGTLGNAATLVGYLGHKDGLVLVSVMYNGHRVYAAKQQQWRLFRLLGADGTMVPGDSMGPDIFGGEDTDIPPAPPAPITPPAVPDAIP